jgi:hypothetical protein
MARLRPTRLLGDLYTTGHGECFKVEVVRDEKRTRIRGYLQGA